MNHIDRMNRRLRAIVPAAALVAFASAPAHGQVLSFSAAAETGGDNVHVLFSEVGLAQPGMGFQPVGSLGGYMVFHEGANSWGVTPAVGLRYRTDVGFTQVKVGYALRGQNGTPFFGGTGSGLYTGLHTEYWGDGRTWAQGLANYNLGAHYLWTRGRLGRNFFTLGNGGSIGLGAEVAYQLETQDRPPGSEGFKATQIGPVLRWNTRPDGATFHFSGGWKEARDPTPQIQRAMASTWYLKGELHLP